MVLTIRWSRGETGGAKAAHPRPTPSSINPKVRRPIHAHTVGKAGQGSPSLKSHCGVGLRALVSALRPLLMISHYRLVAITPSCILTTADAPAGATYSE